MTPEEIKLFGQPLFDKGARSATTATHRRCTTCQQWKEYSEYHKDKNRIPQIIHICKVCESERRNKKRQAKYAKIEKKYGKMIPASRGTLTETHKRCPKCLEWKSYDQFQRNKANLMNLANLCASCQYAYDIQRRYGMGWEEYTTLLTTQGGGCAICGATKGSEKSDRLFVDHDHKTGEIRGLLCSQCNSMLGYSRDDVANLRRGIQYLERASK
jgi:hypothetical protein